MSLSAGGHRKQCSRVGRPHDRGQEKEGFGSEHEGVVRIKGKVTWENYLSENTSEQNPGGLEMPFKEHAER